MKFQEYLPIHEEIYPRPPKRNPSRSWKFWAALSVVTASIVLAALRTAHSFYDAAVLSAQIYGVGNVFTGGLALVEAAAAMVAIEGGIVWGAIERSQQKRKVHPKLHAFYIFLLIAISVIAGLGQSLGLILGLSGQVLAIFSWVMAIVLGVGASIVAWLAGEMLGVNLLRFDEEQRAADKSFNAALTRWTNKARKRWFEVKDQPAREGVVAPASKPLEPHDQHKERVREFIDKFTLRERRFPSPAEISKAVGLTGPYVVRILDELKSEVAPKVG